MKKPVNKAKSARTLRQMAEAELGKRAKGVGTAKMTKDELQTLIHELQTHQIELEMLNEELRAIEAALMESRDKYSDLYDVSPAGYATVNEKGLIVEVNLTFGEMVGVPRLSLMHKPFSRFICAEDQDVFYLLRRTLANTKETQSCELRLKRPRGKFLWTSLSCMVIGQSDAAGPMFRAAVVEITDQKRAEAMVRAERDRAENYLRIAGVIIVALNVEGRVTEINRKGCEVLMVSQQDVLEQSWIDTFVPVSDQERTRREFTGLMAGDIVPGEYFENAVIADNGDERLIAWRNTLIRDESGAIVGTLSSGEDITERKRAENALKDSERLFRIVVDTIPDLVWLKDSEGVYLTCNRRFSDFFGAPESEIAGKTDYDFVSPEQADFFRAHDRKAMEAGGPNQNEEWVTFAGDGHRELLETIKTPIRDSEGSLIGVLGIGRDMTKRKEAEEALRKSEGLFRKVFEVLPVGLWIANKDGTLISGNPAGVKIWGGSPLVGQSNYEVFKARLLPSDEEIKPDDWALAHTIKEGVTILDELLEIDAFDGVTRTILNSTAPVLDDKGNIEAAIVVNQDITRMKEAEDAVRSSERDLAEAQRIARIGSWLWDVEAGAVRWSDEMFRIFGVDAQDLNFELAKSLVHPEDVQAWEQAVRMAVERKAPLNIDYRALCPDGRMIWIHSEAQVIQDENDRVVSVQGTSQDITERKSVEEVMMEQLAELQRWHAVTLNREDRVIELKKEVNGLLSRLGHDPKYQSVQEE